MKVKTTKQQPSVAKLRRVAISASQGSRPTGNKRSMKINSIHLSNQFRKLSCFRQNFIYFFVAPNSAKKSVIAFLSKDSASGVKVFVFLIISPYCGTLFDK